MEIVGVWEDATAMRANRAKTAIIPIGKTVRDFNRDKQELTRLLNEIGLPGPSEEEWEIYLGAPIASDKKVYKTFLEKKNHKLTPNPRDGRRAKQLERAAAGPSGTSQSEE